MSDLNVSSASVAQSTSHSTTTWWYTLAHEETPPARLGASATELYAFSEALTARSQASSSALIAQIAREVACAEAKQRVRAPFGGLGGQGERYVWAFRRLGDALAALRANHRSDYHAYPHPQTLREASLDRLYQRFPLDDFPRTTVLLFTGVRLCEDPRLLADPRADTLASAAPSAIASEEWERYTLCGFQQGVSLTRVTAESRWLRLSARTLEDTWAEARNTLERSIDTNALNLAEARARDALLRAAPADAFLTLDEEPRDLAYLARTSQRAASPDDAPRPLGSALHRARRASGDAEKLSRPGGKRLPYTARRPAV